jgi:hypothetical protein
VVPVWFPSLFIKELIMIYLKINNSLFGKILFVLLLLTLIRTGLVYGQNKKMKMADLNLGVLSNEDGMMDVYFAFGLFNNLHKIPFGFWYRMDWSVERDNYANDTTVVQSIFNHNFKKYAKSAINRSGT